MLLTITCTSPEGAGWPATDLGFLLHKNPDRVQAFEQSYGTAHVLYPEAATQRCTAALLLEIDPIRLVRGRSRSTPDFSLGQYVNDRPYAASSLLSVAIGSVFRTALHGQCKQRPELVEAALPLRIELPAVPCKGGPEVAERVFGPLGWDVSATALPLDPAFPEWGDSHHLRLELTGTLRLSDALSHLYVLLPVLDGAKHYWVAADEVDKLIRAGGGWLADHPDRAWISRRYLARRQSLVRTALARLAEVDETDAEDIGAVEEVLDGDGMEVTDPGPGDSVRATSESDRSVVAAAASSDHRAATPTAQRPIDAEARAGHGPATDGAPNEAVGSDAATSGADPTMGAESAARATSTLDAEPDAASQGADPTTDAESAARATSALDAEPDAAAQGADSTADDEAAARVPSLAVQRRAAVLAALQDVGARRVLDLGCGEGALLRELLADKMFSEVVGVDVSMRALNIAKRKLRLERMPERMAQRLTLMQGALTYTDARLRGYDAAVLMEVIEHVDPPRLGALEYAVFAGAAPGAVVVTTPNAEVNVRFEGMAPGAFRHADHRFEWTRAEFAAWADTVAARYGYAAQFVPIGPVDPELGAPTQMAVFTKAARVEAEAVR